MKNRSGILACAIALFFFCGCAKQPEAPAGTSSAETVVTDPAVQTVQTVPTETSSTVPTELTVSTATGTAPSDTVPAEQPDTEDFVAVTDYIPDLLVDLKYATEDNFTGKAIYNFSVPYLRYGTVCKLALVQEELRSMGLGLKLWDGFRPPSAQYKLWEICPDPVYVSNPNNGFSNHARGDTVDITLVDSRGMELEMPTGFDDFTSLADRDYSDCSEEATRNAILLEQIMKKYGFTGYHGEWWHFTDVDDYPVEMDFLSGGR